MSSILPIYVASRIINCPHYFRPRSPFFTPIKPLHKDYAQLYLLADSGRKSLALLHELANELMIVSILAADQKDSPLLNIYSKMNTLLHETSRDLTSTTIQTFSLSSYLKDTLIPSYAAEAARYGVSLRFSYVEGSPVLINGEPAQVQMIIGILLRNAFESYSSLSSAQKLVTIELTMTRRKIHLCIIDTGIGIPPDRRPFLFHTKTTKTHGHGIGLFVAKEIMRHHFKGELLLDPTEEKTSFHMIFPRVYPS